MTHTKEEIIDHLSTRCRQQLLAAINNDQYLTGRLSSSAVSTAVAMTALHTFAPKRHEQHIDKAIEWLLNDRKPDGSWGDSPESPANPTATLLAYAALRRQSVALPETEVYLVKYFGGIDEERLIDGVLRYYGSDFTFSVPILVMCGVCGVINSWDRIPSLPFELALFPQRMYKFLRLPVVSYAIPALIAVGILLLKRKKATNLFSRCIYSIRERCIAPSLQILRDLQPQNGGFLEAPPLTGFVLMCLTEAGYNRSSVAASCARFLEAGAREDGSWPIDTDLSTWVTTLATPVIGVDISRDSWNVLLRHVEKSQQSESNLFTGAPKGGFAWTNECGGVPDADDTASGLHALHHFFSNDETKHAVEAVRWLFSVQNRDGGIATFCRGWGKLPFDRSSPDITAHAISGIELWMPLFEPDMRDECRRRVNRMKRWLARSQAKDGSWTPLWFGDQDAPDQTAPVYGTAVVCGHLLWTNPRSSDPIVKRGIEYLLASQNADGGWGGAKGISSKITITAQVLFALADSPIDCTAAIDRALIYLQTMSETDKLFRLEPIGLYFAKLWYSEQLYTPIFLYKAMRRLLRIERKM